MGPQNANNRQRDQPYLALIDLASSLPTSVQLLVRETGNRFGYYEGRFRGAPLGHTRNYATKKKRRRVELWLVCCRGDVLAGLEHCSLLVTLRPR